MLRDQLPNQSFPDNLSGARAPLCHTEVAGRVAGALQRTKRRAINVRGGESLVLGSLKTERTT